jgi:hypothetical protein
VPTRILLDLDGTDDPTYGAQEGTAYHAYYLTFAQISGNMLPEGA